MFRYLCVGVLVIRTSLVARSLKVCFLTRDAWSFNALKRGWCTALPAPHYARIFKGDMPHERTGRHRLRQGTLVFSPPAA